ncbi:hypothetical protein [Streptomyces sp. NPDC015350]|uniref:hypothetical protein n=1 Tax=Streptomyces sp. NPDC015350 TaxID=3364955 RepID=UPI0036F4C095
MLLPAREGQRGMRVSYNIHGHRRVYWDRSKKDWEYQLDIIVVVSYDTAARMLEWDCRHCNGRERYDCSHRIYRRELDAFHAQAKRHAGDHATFPYGSPDRQFLEGMGFPLPPVPPRKRSWFDDLFGL